MGKKKVLFVATVVKTHIMQFHIPYLKMLQQMGWETAVAARNDYDDPQDCHIPYCDAYYDIPFEEIKKISMAGINIGPWGKDFHKLTERVLMENLYDRTPHILDHAITILLG